MSYYRHIPGAAERAARAKRERERRELETWTRNRPGEFSGFVRSRDPEVRKRWCSFYNISFRRSKPRPRFPSYRGMLEITELSDSDSSTGSSDNAVIESKDFASKKGSGRPMVPPSGEYVVTAHQFSAAFHLDGRPNSEAIFWSRQMETYSELWQSVGLMLEDEEFVEVYLSLSSVFIHLLVYQLV